ncbi:hypothetical protein R6Q59_011211 [Mikania micrantha]
MVVVRGHQGQKRKGWVVFRCGVAFPVPLPKVAMSPEIRFRIPRANSSSLSLSKEVVKVRRSKGIARLLSPL